jgi:uncharacterized delta-60 repeat protein
MRFAKRLTGVAAIGLSLLAGPALAATGDLDRSFGRDGLVTLDWGGDDLTQRGVDLALAPDGRIVVLGLSSGSSSNYDFAFARLRGNGDLDSTFGSGGLRRIERTGSEAPQRLALQADGKIVAVGTLISTWAQVMRLESTGTLDPGFGTSGVFNFNFSSSATLDDVALQRDGKILIAGGGAPFDAAIVMRLTPADGNPDPSFGSGGTSAVDLTGAQQAEAVAIQADGKVLIAGYTTSTSPTRALVARFDTAGKVDPGFGTGGLTILASKFGTSVSDAIVQPDGKIVLATFGANGVTVARLNTDGTPDASFDDDGLAVLNFSFPAAPQSLALQADGKVLVGAGATGLGNDFGLVGRLQPNGVPDATFHGSGKVQIPGIRGASKVVIQPDGKILLVGGDATYSDAAVVARLQGDSPGISGSPGGPGGPSGGGPTAKLQRCAGRKATIVGTKRSDRLKGTRRADVIVSLGGNDKIDAAGGNDVVCAGEGNDSLKGGPGNDRLYGQNGKDSQAGGAGNDKLDGGSGNDRLSGDAGRDTLAGGAGKDRLGGGGGSDSCNGGGGKDSAACERSRAL